MDPCFPTLVNRLPPIPLELRTLSLEESVYIVVFGLGAVLASPRGHPAPWLGGSVAPWLAARGVLAEL